MSKKRLEIAKGLRVVCLCSDVVVHMFSHYYWCSVIFVQTKTRFCFNILSPVLSLSCVVKLFLFRTGCVCD